MIIQGSLQQWNHQPKEKMWEEERSKRGGMADRARAEQPGVENREEEEGSWCSAPQPLLPALRGRRVGSLKGGLFIRTSGLVWHQLMAPLPSLPV